MARIIYFYTIQRYAPRITKEMILAPSICKIFDRNLIKILRQPSFLLGTKIRHLLGINLKNVYHKAGWSFADNFSIIMDEFGLLSMIRNNMKWDLMKCKGYQYFLIRFVTNIFQVYSKKILNSSHFTLRKFFKQIKYFNTFSVSHKV